MLLLLLKEFENDLHASCFRFNLENYKTRSSAAELVTCFQATGAFFLTPPTHGIFYISHDDLSDTPMICVIVENGIDVSVTNQI